MCIYIKEMKLKDENQLYNTLNNLFHSDTIIDDVIRLKKNGDFPEEIRSFPYKKAQYEERFKDLYVNDDEKLIFRPLNLIVVPKEDTENVLKDVYDDEKNGLGKSQLTLYKFVRRNYLNITREDVGEFIRKQTNYQLTHDFGHRVNKPIVSKYPQQLWCTDLISMEMYKKNNKGYLYILNVMDVFSRKLWLERLKRKDGISMVSAFQRIIDRAGVKCKYLISDNGGEYIGEEFATFCRENDIKQRLTRTYSPQANGLIERSNRDIRKIIRAYMTDNENRIWFNLLPKVENNKNQIFHSVLNTFPDNVWTPTTEPIKLRDDLPSDELRTNLRQNKRTIQIKARNRILKKVKKEIAKFKDTQLNVGDFVRIQMTSISSNLRRIVKADRTKQVMIRYTPIIFRISKKITPKQGVLERNRYMVEDLQGRPLCVKRLTNREGDSNVYTVKQFYSNELLHIPTDVNGTQMTLKKAIELNGVKINQNDLTLLKPDEENNIPKQGAILINDLSPAPVPRRSSRNSANVATNRFTPPPDTNYWNLDMLNELQNISYKQ